MGVVVVVVGVVVVVVVCCCCCCCCCSCLAFLLFLFLLVLCSALMPIILSAVLCPSRQQLQSYGNDDSGGGRANFQGTSRLSCKCSQALPVDEILPAYEICAELPRKCR